MNNFKCSWDALLIASIVFVAGICAQAQQAAWALDSTEPEGPIVEIAPAPTEQATIEEQPEQPEQPAYWIGIRGRNVTEPVLRTQFQLAQDLGVVIEEVVKNSPAAKAGLRQHDILLRANGEAVQSMEDLSHLVGSGDAKPIELLLIRLSKEETIVVVPEERPAGMENSGSGLGGFGDGFGDAFGGGGFGDGGGFGGGGGGFGFDLDEADPMGAFRLFRGGLIVPPQGGAMALNSKLPNGYAVTITRENDQPVRITVKKGDQTWTIVGDDEEALEQLPEDVRRHVQGLLIGSVNMGLGNDLKKQLRNFQLRAWPGGELWLPQDLPFNDQQDRVLKRMEQLERQLKELQRRLEESDATE